MQALGSRTTVAVCPYTFARTYKSKVAGAAPKTQAPFWQQRLAVCLYVHAYKPASLSSNKLKQHSTNLNGISNPYLYTHASSRATIGQTTRVKAGWDAVRTGVHQPYVS